MVQVLSQEGFADRAGAQLGQGLGSGLSQGLQLLLNQKIEDMHKDRRQKTQGKTFEELGLPSGLAFLDPQLQKEYVKQHHLQKGRDQIFGKTGIFGLGDGGEELPLKKLSPSQKVHLAFTDPQALKAYESVEKDIEKKEEVSATRARLKDSLGDMFSTLNRGNLGYTSKRFATSKGREDAHYFDTLGVQIEGIGKEMVSKGILSQARFNYLLKNIPSSSKSDAANRGALKAWSKILQLPIPGLTENEEEEVEVGEETDITRPKGKKEVTKEIALKFMKISKGDRDKARELARKHGYEI